MSSSIKFVGTEATSSVAERLGPIIKVIGLGGGGGNAVNFMHAAHIQGVDYICANTDAQALAASPVETRIQLGESGLGAGANPEKGRDATQHNIDAIKNSIKDSDMVFITAGMGGGTGTGSAPVVAQAARELGILTVGVVTEPFTFERARRNKVAQAGIEELKKHVDSLICIPNDKLMKVLGEDFNLNDAFAHANEVLFDAVQGITEIVTVPGIINVDFEDLRTVMSERGSAMMGMGVASGDDRAVKATQRAIANPLLEDIKIDGARGILANISSANTLSIGEFHKVGAELDRLVGGDDETTVIIGTSIDESLGDEVRVMVVATGLESTAGATEQKPQVQIATNPIQQPQVEEATVTQGVSMQAANAETMSLNLQSANQTQQVVQAVQTTEASMQEAISTAANLVNSAVVGQAAQQNMQVEASAKRAVGDYQASSGMSVEKENWLDIPAFLRRQVD